MLMLMTQMSVSSVHWMVQSNIIESKWQAEVNFERVIVNDTEDRSFIDCLMFQKKNWQKQYLYLDHLQTNQ